MARRETREAPEIGAAVSRMLTALTRRAGGGEAEAVEELARLERHIAGALGLGVRLYRAGPAEASWTDVARLVGTTRQAAHRRFSEPGDEDVEVVHAETPETTPWPACSSWSSYPYKTTTRADEVTCLAAACVLAKRSL